MQLFYQPDINDGVDYLDAEESKHCIKVLRKHQHDSIDIVDGKGTFYKALITEANPRQTKFEITEQRQETSSAYQIHLAVAPTKRLERMEWLVEKATELGVESLTFVECEHSQRSKLRMDRLHRKAVSAMKQSLKAKVPVLEDICPFNHLVQSADADSDKYLAHLEADAPYLGQEAIHNSQALIIIGPEGDFSQSEISTDLKSGFKMAKLGNQRLRTETAALTALITLQLNFQRLEI